MKGDTMKFLKGGKEMSKREGGEKHTQKKTTKKH